MITSSHPLAPLFDPTYIRVSVFITIAVIASYLLIILWSTTSWAAFLNKIIKKTKLLGPLIIRLAVSSSFFFAAQSNCFLGPELSLTSLPLGQILRFFSYVISLLVFFGFLTELAAFLGLCMFLYSSYYVGTYMFTYANYFGEFFVLFLFGSRFLSIDRLIFGTELWIKKLKKYQYWDIAIVRILYGLGLMYAGYNIKFLHQILTVWVYNQYHLKDFFHASAAFIAAGAGVSELLIGLFILLGFVMRFTVLISLVFITLSLVYFHELLWPHIILYGISLSLLINSADFLTIDHYMIPWAKNVLTRITGKILR